MFNILFTIRREKPENLKMVTMLLDKIEVLIYKIRIVWLI